MLLVKRGIVSIKVWETLEYRIPVRQNRAITIVYYLYCSCRNHWYFNSSYTRRQALAADWSRRVLITIANDSGPACTIFPDLFGIEYRSFRSSLTWSLPLLSLPFSWPWFNPASILWSCLLFYPQLSIHVLASSIFDFL